MLTTQRVATVVQAQGDIGVGYYTVQVGSDQAAQENAHADTIASRAGATESEHQLDEVADSLRAIEASIRRCLDSGLAAVEDANQAQKLVLSNIGRSA